MEEVVDSQDLKSEFVEIEGFGTFEIREPLFEDIEPFFGGLEQDAKSFGMNILKKCLYKDGRRVWDKPVGAKLGMKLMALSPKVMNLIGFGDEGKDSPAES